MRAQYTKRTQKTCLHLRLKTWHSGRYNKAQCLDCLDKGLEKRLRREQRERETKMKPTQSELDGLRDKLQAVIDKIANGRQVQLGEGWTDLDEERLAAHEYYDAATRGFERVS